MFIIKYLLNLLYCLVSLRIIFGEEENLSIDVENYSNIDPSNRNSTGHHESAATISSGYAEYKLRSRFHSSMSDASNFSYDYSDVPSENDVLSPQHQKIYDNLVPILFPRHVPDEICGIRYGEAKLINNEYFRIETRGNLGSLMKNELTYTEPKMSYLTATDDTFYTIILVDIDAPSRKNPVHRLWLHWLVSNVRDWYVGGGDLIAEYVGPWPQNGTGIHRYAALVYEQKSRLVFNETFIPKENFKARRNFNHYAFSKKYNLGKPTCTDFFSAEWSPIIDERYKQYINN